MTSKISYFNFTKSDIRHRGWLAALSAVLMLLLLPIYTFISIDVWLSVEPYAKRSLDFQGWLMNTLPGFLNGTRNRPLAVFIAALAILCAVTGFSYLHSKEKQDFYHGMPVKRTQWFGISYLGGLVIFTVPYLLSGLCTLLLCQTKGYMDAPLLVNSLIAMSGGILGFLICYHTCILAMFLTGRIVTGILAALVLLVYGSIINTLYAGLASSFFDTWAHNSPDITAQLWNYSSPYYLFTCALSSTALHRGTVQMVIACIVICTVLAVLALLVCRYYPSEAAMKALAFPKSAPAVKVLIAVPTALFAGLTVSRFWADLDTGWIIFISIAAALLLCLLIEFIYHQDLTQLLKGKVSSAISVGAVIVIICVLRFDIFGFDRYLPKEAKLDDMSVYCDDISGYFSYPESYSLSSYGQPATMEAAIKDYEPLYQLAKEGIANTQQGITPLSIRKASTSDDFVNITLRYGIGKGKNIYRNYAVNRTALLQAMEKLCQDEAYRKELFPVFHLERDKVSKMSVTDIYRQATPLSISKEQIYQLLDAYEKDVLEADIAIMQYEDPLGELTVDIPDENAAGQGSNAIAQLGKLYIYSSYNNTIGLLEQLGCTLQTQISPDDVVLMTYYPNEGPSDTVSITVPAEIQKILEKITFNQSSRLLGNSQKTLGSVEVLLKGKTNPDTFVIYE